MDYQQVLYSVSDHIATVTLNRPQALNAWTDLMAEEVWQATHEAERDPNVRVIVLTGAGRAFCAGGDVNAFSDLRVGAGPQGLLDKLPRNYDFSKRPDYQSRASYFPALSKPVIAMLNGATAGLGLLHALFADIRFAAEDAVLTTSLSRLGLGSEYGMAWALRNAVGHAGAMDLLLSGRKVRGIEAARMGLVNQVFPLESLAESTYAYAREMASLCSPRSLRVVKRQMWELPFQTLHEAVLSDSQEMFVGNLSNDFEEGKRAFKEKRPPQFTGT